MSHVLHVWEGPTPDSPDDVAKLLDAPPAGLAPSARFPEFAAALRKKYPDADTLEARGKDGEDAVWSDSPLEGETQSPFMVLGLRIEKTDRKLVNFIVKTAGAHGLHVYDSQTGELWRKDDPPPPLKRPKPPRLPTPEAPMMSLHRFASVPPWSVEGLPGRPEAQLGERMELRAAEAQQVVMQPIAQRLASFGWEEGRGFKGRTVLSRFLGPARQIIEFYIGDTLSFERPLERVDFYVVSVSFNFEIPAVQEALFRLLPRWRKKRAAERSAEVDGYADILCPLRDVFGIEAQRALHYALITPTYAAARVRFRRDMEWWPQVFNAWYESQAEPLLAACTDLVTLNRFLGNAHRLSSGMQEREWTLMSTLALARMAPHDEVPWEDVLTGVRYRADRLALDEALLERTIAALVAPPLGDVA